jgi:hypothetical protein
MFENDQINTANTRTRALRYCHVAPLIFEEMATPTHGLASWCWSRRSHSTLLTNHNHNRRRG